MTIKLATATFALVFLVAWASEATAHRSYGQTPDQPPLVLTGDVGSGEGASGAAEGDSEVLVADPEQPEPAMVWVGTAEPGPSEFPISGLPEFLPNQKTPPRCTSSPSRKIPTWFASCR